MAQSKKKEVKTEVKEENTGYFGRLGNYEGQFVSLDMKKTTFFGVGEREDGQKKVWLSPTNWFDKIPDDLTSEETEIVAKSLAAGTIVVGTRWLPAVSKDKTIKEQYIRLLREHRTADEEFKTRIRAFVRHKNHGGYTAQEILNEMITREKESANRVDILEFLNDGLSYYHGPAILVEDYPDDTDNYSITIDMETFKVLEVKEKAPRQKKKDESFKGLDTVPAERTSAVTKTIG
jgi:hypothetical protein